MLSFVLERGEGFLDGEVVVSAETALRTAPRFGWSAAEELLLYVIHGTLHLAGYDDATPEQQAAMRGRETEYLAAARHPGTAREDPLSLRERVMVRVIVESLRKEYRVTRRRHSGWRRPGWS